jgi:hypothetical protein
MVRALLDHKSASRNGLANEFSKAVDRTIRVPCHIGEQFQRMAADSETEQIRFPFQALAARWLIKRDAGQLLKPWR